MNSGGTLISTMGKSTVSWFNGSGIILDLRQTLALCIEATTAIFPIVCLAVSVVLFLVATLAIYAPARRAARIDPMVALRYE